MKFTRLRLTGFKSFVEPAELVIESGLTGVVGPNGCGKSNLLEALRWVMGESSYKSMRASGMEDVIFSGTASRPSRNMAEVLVTLDNSARMAPPAFNGEETLEVSRRIERDAGSAYRINGRDARARDVQLLFADVSTGARSPALVRQGQIAEIIDAKPQARRMILEEAAGITGLHTRRHEAELKLRAAEQNLTRIDDVVAQLEAQVNSLKRQARQAHKYKQVSAEIRKLEAASLYAGWKDAEAQVAKDGHALDEATRALAEQTRVASADLRAREAAADALPALREAEAVRAAVLQRLTIERHTLEAEERRAEERGRELDSRLIQIDGDLARAQEAICDTDGVIARLAAEAGELEAAQAGDVAVREAAASELRAAADGLTRAQETADAKGAELSELNARRASLERGLADARARIAKLEREAADLASRRAALSAAAGGDEVLDTLGQAVELAQTQATSAEAAAGEADTEVRAARQREAVSRQGFEETRQRADRLQTEIQTLGKLLKATDGGLWPPVIDALSVAPGFETALGAAFGDDLDASADEGAPVHWRGLPPLDESQPLPGGAEPLSAHVQAPAALHRRLSQIGVVPKALGAALQPQLASGQRLVSREGDVWRWDGFSSAADAPSAAAKRLAERNRLQGLEIEARALAHEADAARLGFEAARAEAESASRVERERRDGWRAATSALDTARRALQIEEHRQAERQVQTGALHEAMRRVEAALLEAHAGAERLQADSAALPPTADLANELAAAREALNGARTRHADARARHDGHERDSRARAERLAALAREAEAWRARAAKARMQIDDLDRRRDEARVALTDLADLPKAFADRRGKLMTALGEAETGRKAAADALAEAETTLRVAEQAMRQSQDRAATAREDHARVEARLDHARERLAEWARRSADVLGCAPDAIVETMGLDVSKLAPAAEIERKLASLRDDRERLGAVNLRAEEEALEAGRRLDELVRERDDLVQAIGKLRGGIAGLNREGRQRLLDAFGTVNANFAELFTTLFSGGKAELQLIESDDPLEAGLEILAHPPGKKPTVLSLLSGGEQALTALALIFAVFLTNPSPICVLDEVDAPLDDHNVERFCNLLDAMLERTETRFLIITHHPLTMARMHRLFGVTMMERGVSQLVSVDLERAERLREAG